MKIYNFEQRSEEWYNIRKLKGTASKATAIKTQGKGLDTLSRELVLGYLQGKEDEFVSESMQNGIDMEQQAKDVYSLINNVSVEDVGFVEYNDYIGCSPDGLVEDKGLVEIKCLSNKVYFNEILLDDKIPSEYFDQCQMQMLITGREWCDLMFYNPNFTKSYAIYRILPDNDTKEKLLKGFEMLEEKIKYYLEKINHS